MRGGGKSSLARQEDFVEIPRCGSGLDPFIFVTTRVNYGGGPAGCIAIPAVWETAARFGKGREEAAWFLKKLNVCG